MASDRRRGVSSSLALGAMTALTALVCAGCSASAPAPAPRSSTASGPATDAAPGLAAEHPTSAPSPDAPRTSEPAVADEDTVVTIGDSIMAGYGVDDHDAWPALLAADTGRPVVNLACSGAGFVAVGDCGTDFWGLIPEAVAARPAVVLIQSSDNDLSESRESIDEATSSTILALRRALPDARIVGLNTLWNPPEDEPDSIAWSTESLRSAIEAAGGSFAWIGQPLHDETDLLQWDEEHPTEAGQRVLSDAVLSALREAGVGL